MQDQRNTRRVMIKLDPDGVRSEIEVNINCKFWELMRKSSQLLNLKMSEFYIFTKQGPLPESVYNEYMKDYDLKEVQFQRRLQEDMEKEFPSYVIGYQRESLQVFLDVLKNHDDEITSESIGLIELLQINPQIKGYISDKINKLKVPTAITQDVEDLQHFNYIDWVDMLKWDQSQELNETFYMLTCLKELTIGKQGLQGGVGNPDVIQNQLVSHAQQKLLTQERQNRLDIQKNILQKGGFHFLIHVFNSVKKETDFEKDILTSKTLQLLIFLFSQLHSVKHQAIINQIEKPHHVKDMIGGTLTIVHQFMLNIVKKQAELQQQLEAKQNDQHDIITQTTIINQKLQNQHFDTNILTVSLNFLTKILTQCPNSFIMFQQNEKFYQILQLGLIEITQKRIQDKISIFSLNLCTKIEQYVQKINENMTLPSFLIIEKCIKEFIPLSLKEKNTQKMRVLYKMLNQIFSDTDVYKLLSKIEQPGLLAANLIKIIQEREINESSSRDEDVVLGGLFDFLGQILTRFAPVRQNLQDRRKFIEFLTHQGLFKKEKRLILQYSQGDETIQKNLPPMCKNPQTRNSCLDLLRILCLDEIQDKLFITQYLKQNVCQETFWRTPRKVDWSIQLQQQERSISGFVGLKNLGCICYMNSILQNLFMIPAFRKMIIEVEDRNQDQQPSEENVLFQVKCIFGGLMEVEKQYYNPKKFCKALKDLDGSSIDPMVQQDVDEFFIMFMDRLEGLIKGTKEEKIMNNLFQGVFANELICKDCPHYSEREEPFLAIILQVKNKSSVHESLKFYIEGEMLEGDNAYYCEKCEKKVNTLKRCCIKRMPNILFLVLKRFEFDFDSMQKVKVNDYCEFPLELDMSPYSQQELARNDLIKLMDEKNLTVDELNEDKKHILNRKVPENYYKYKLKGIVVHYGTADQGHYYSFIQDRENKNQGWFEFNDTIVKDFDASEIPEETFGGDDANLTNNISEMQSGNNGQVDQGMIQAMRQFKTKIKNAYVLIYDRVEFFDQSKINDLIDDVKTINLSPKEIAKQYQNFIINQNLQMSMVPQIPHNVHDVILAKNKKFWLSQTIFSPFFISSMYNVFKDLVVVEDQDYQKYSEASFNLQETQELDQFEALKFIITFFLTIGLRSKDRSVLPDYVTLIRNALKKHIGLCLWLVETFSSQDFIKEFFIDCPIHDMSRFTQGLLKTAMQQVYQNEVGQIDEIIKMMDQPGDVVNQFVKTTQGQYIEEDSIVDGRSTPPNLDQAIYSGCQKVNVIRLKGNCAKLPKLVILINSFIHMSTSYHLLKSFKMTGQFWALFSNFSLLGDKARLYLLKSQTLGRFIDYLLNLTNQDAFFSKQALFEYQTKFRDQSLRVNFPLILYSKSFYIGMDPDRSQVQLTVSERKQIANLISNQHTFLILTISNLARSCTLIKPDSQQTSIFQLDNLNFVPEKEEIELLQSHKNVRWWSASHSKLARNSISIMFAHISTENKEFTFDYIHNLIMMFSMEQSIYVRHFERPILRVVQIVDKIQQDRIKRILQKLFELFRLNTQYFMQMESMLELLTRLTIRSPIFAQIFQKNFSDFLRMIDRYYKENPSLPIGGTNKSRIFKEGHVRWNEIKSSFLNQQKIDWITNYIRNRASKFFNHLKKQVQEQSRIAKLAGANDCIIVDHGNILSLTGEVDADTQTQSSTRSTNPVNLSDIDLDSDEDMYNKIFERGQYVDFINQGIWYKGVIQIVLEEMVYCVAIPQAQPNIEMGQHMLLQNTNISIWIDLESDKIAPENTVTSSDREHLHKFLRDLYGFMVPIQQSNHKSNSNLSIQ